MGLAPQIVEEIFGIVRDLNQQERVSFLLAEQNTNVALRFADYGYILETGRVVMDGSAAELSSNEDVKEFYLGLSAGERKNYRDAKHYRRRKRWLGLTRILMDYFRQTGNARPRAARRGAVRRAARADCQCAGQGAVFCARARRRQRGRYQGPRGTRVIAGHAQVRSDRSAKGGTAFRRHDGVAAVRTWSRIHVAGPDVRSRRQTRGLLAARARDVRRRFSRGRTRAQHVLVPLHAGRLHGRHGCARNRLRRISRRHRADRDAGCGHRELEAAVLYRHAVVSAHHSRERRRTESRSVEREKSAGVGRSAARGFARVAQRPRCRHAAMLCHCRSRARRLRVARAGRHDRRRRRPARTRAPRHRRAGRGG